ncbi:MAG TPA: acetyl-CoA carboxylase carboxyltransferase subunit beta [Spirochaetes bacterium]|nr:acetyl-CoA carboxylase carboxyltransferase subunit beta [Spirochaetota bacterium]
MAWFNKPKYGLKAPDHRTEKPKGLWTRCFNCKEIIYNREWEENLRVCPRCGYHYRLNSKERIQLLIDQGSFQEHDKNLSSVDPLGFENLGQKYQDKLIQTQKKTGLKDAIVTGTGLIHGIKTELCVMDFSFFGGSMGSVIGEKIVRAIQNSIKQRIPLIIVSCSGGARMQEGVYSLMQMAKTCSALTKLADEKILYISVLTDPTTGGVTASFASIGDITIAEPNALIGFAGPRVIEQTIKQKLPNGFQSSEFLLEHGFIDFIVGRKELKNQLAQLLHFFS